MKTVYSTWEEFKTDIAKHSAQDAIQYEILDDNRYVIKFISGFFIGQYILPFFDSEDKTDFDNNYRDIYTHSIMDNRRYYTTDYRVVPLTQDQEISRDIMDNIFSYNGVGFFSDFVLKFSTSSIYIQLVIDGKIIIPKIELGAIIKPSKFTNLPLYRDGSSLLIFSPKEKIKFVSSIEILSGAEQNNKYLETGQLTMIEG